MGSDIIDLWQGRYYLQTRTSRGLWFQRGRLFLGKIVSFQSARPLGLVSILEINNQINFGFPLCVTDKREAKERTWIFQLTPYLISLHLDRTCNSSPTYPT